MRITLNISYIGYEFDYRSVFYNETLIGDDWYSIFMCTAVDYKEVEIYDTDGNSVHRFSIDG